MASHSVTSTSGPQHVHLFHFPFGSETFPLFFLPWSFFPWRCRSTWASCGAVRRRCQDLQTAEEAAAGSACRAAGAPRRPNRSFCLVLSSAAHTGSGVSRRSRCVWLYVGWRLKPLWYASDLFCCIDGPESKRQGGFGFQRRSERRSERRRPPRARRTLWLLNEEQPGSRRG